MESEPTWMTDRIATYDQLKVLSNQLPTPPSSVVPSIKLASDGIPSLVDLVARSIAKTDVTVEGARHYVFYFYYHCY